MGSFPIIFLFFTFLAIILRPFLVLFHELGHAIPAILMTKEVVSIYIGSYGDPSKSLHFNIGLLDIWVQFNPFSWRQGLCIPSAKQISINKQIVYTLAGPIASFLIALFACYFTFTYNLHGFLKLILIIFLFLSILDLVTNLIPRTLPIQLYDGRIAYNDGYQLKQLFYYKKYLKEYENAIELYNLQKFEESALTFCNILKRGLKDENIYRLALSSLIQLKNYEKAIEIFNEFNLLGELNSEDYVNAGLAYSQINQHNKALEYYDKSLELDPKNIYSINNKGYTLSLLNKFDEAILLFDKAIEIDNEFAYSYNNRGLAKIKTGRIEEGLKEINHSLILDKNNSYGYRNLGIYFLDIGNNEKALELFKQAKALNNSTHLIDELILETKIK
jgi:tetratricopeptide (TPR) repeat protein